jgi:hypothetical protein
MNIIVGFTHEYWLQWGVGWLASLKQFARYDEQIVFVLHDSFPKITVQQLSKYGVVIQLTTSKDYCYETINAALSMMKKTEKNIFFHGDLYFQQSLESLASYERLFYAPNGLLGGTKSQFEDFLQFYKITQLVRSYAFSEVIALYAQHFPFIERLPEIWHPELSLLKWNEGFYIHNELAQLIHFGSLKTSPEANNYKFQQKYFSIYEQWDRDLNKSKVKPNLILRMN